MRRALPILALLFLVPAVARAALVAGPARPLAGTAESTGAYRGQSEPSIAWNGDRGLVVWRTRLQHTSLVLASHVDSTGMPLEPRPFILSRERHSSFARVVPLGSGFLVVWQVFVDNSAPLNGALVGRDGAVRHLGALTSSPFHPNNVASNGSTVLIAGSTGDPEYRSALIWLDVNGQVFARKTFGDMLMITTRVRSDGTSFFVVAGQLVCGTYTCEHTFSLVRAEADGTLTEPRVLRHVKEVQSFDYILSAVAVSRDRVLLVFHESRGFMTGMLVEHDGDVIAGPFPVEDPGAAGVPVAAASDGQSFVVAYPHAVFDNPSAPVRTTRLRRVVTSGVAEAEILTNDARAGALEWTGSAYLLASAGGLNGPSESTNVTVRRVPPGGPPPATVPEHVVSRAPNQQDSPSSAWDGSLLFTAWDEYFPSDGSWKVKYGRNTADGKPLDGRGHLVSPSSAHQRNARVVFDGSRFLVLWTEDTGTEREIRARRINADGSPAGDSFTVAGTYCGADFSATRQGDRVLVAHLGAGCSHAPVPRKQILVTYVDASNTATQSAIVAEEVSADHPAIAAGDANALVVWMQHVPRAPSDPCPPSYEYCPFKQVLAAAVVENGTARRVAIAEDGMMVNREPQLAWDGENYLVAWLAARDLLNAYELRTRTFSRGGEPAARAHVLTTNVPPTHTTERHGSVIATASGFVVAWTSRINSLSLWRGAPDGTPELSERTIETDTADLHAPHLVRGPGRVSFLLYSVAGPDELYLGHNLIVWRTVSEPARTRAVRH